MGFSLCLIRGAFGHSGRSAARLRNSAGLLKCATSLPPSALRAKRYSQATADGKDVSGHFACYHLPHRTIVKIRGQETSTFLQGLITNDMGLLVEEPEQSAMYSHMLSVQGRTLYDIILYRLKEVEPGVGVFLECDWTMKDSLLKHLKIYKLRRKIDINHCPELSVWAVFPTQRHTGHDDLKPELSSPDKALAWDSDPRTQEMGWRLVINSQVDPLDVVASCRKGETEDYHKHRYSIGIPEGVRDLPPGVALPLESNLVYMQGISFSKGCYIGQELTARTHHTGVIRKRLMPVRLSAPVQDLEQGGELQTESGKSAGKHRAGVGTLGLSLVRTAHANEVLTLKPSDDTTVTLEASVPAWWPEDATIS